MIGPPANTVSWIAAGVTDLRRGFTGLSALVQTKLEKDPFCGHVFIFRGRRRRAETGEMKRENLSRWIGRLDIASAIAGFIVVIGLVVEDGPELLKSFVTKTWPPRAIIGALLVTLGVLAEVVVAVTIARIAKRIEAMDAEHIANIRRDAIQNIGNRPLNAVTPGLVVGGPNFLQVAGPGTPADCTNAFALTPGAACNL